MSAYNAEQTIRGSIDSILQQTFENFEFIVINDGSNDSTKEILSSYHDTRLIVINQKNQGLTKSLIDGAILAKGKYLARQDADDTSVASRLEKQLHYLENNPDIALLGSWSQQVDSEGAALGQIAFAVSNDEIYEGMVERNQFVHGSIIMKKTAYEAAGAYRSAFRFSQDYDLFLRIVEKFKVENLPEHLYRSGHNINMVSLTHKEDQIYFTECAKALALQRKQGKQDQLDANGTLPDVPRDKNEDYTIIYYRHLISSFLRQGNIKKVREHAIALLKKKPVDVHTWLILFVSLLGGKVATRFVSLMDRYRSRGRA